MVVYNESNISIQLVWPGFKTYCPAWTAMLYCVGSPNATIQWSQLYTLPVSGGAPLSVVVIETYNDNEPILGTYPSALVRSTNVGNALNLSTSVSQVANDGNAANTQFIEATVSGDSASAVSVTNDASVVLGTAANPGSLTLANTFQVRFKDANGAVHTILTEDALNEIKLACAGANNLLFQDNTGVTLATIDGNGIHLNSGTFNFLAGHISRIVYTHIASVTSTAAFVNHNLGVTPDACILVPNDGTLSNGNFSAYYESSSMTSTQVKLQSNSVGGIPVGLWAIKF